MKKKFKVILSIIVTLVILALIFFLIDFSRAKKGEKPIFCILKDEVNDGGTREYIGLGYKVIDFHTLAGFDDAKIGTWFIKYDDFKEEIQEYEKNITETIRALVIKVNENSLYAMGIEGLEEDVFSVGFAEEGNIGFKQGQEILINFSGEVAATYPAQLGKANKIEIVKEKSDIQIPTEILKRFYSSCENVKFEVNDISTKGLTLTITDTNEIPYEYSSNYNIYHKIKNKNYTGVGNKIGEDTEHSTSGYTRKWH